MKNTPALILTGILCLLLAAAGCTNTSPATTAPPAASAVTPAESLTQATATVAPAPGTPTWTGTWNTSWLERDGNRTISVMTFTQNGTDVSGNYSYTYPDVGTYTGSINATVQGNTLSGTYAETDNDLGYFVFMLKEDRNSFTGRWVHAANRSELANSTLTWNGVRE